jgi:hypothetical protein
MTENLNPFEQTCKLIDEAYNLSVKELLAGTKKNKLLFIPLDITISLNATYSFESRLLARQNYWTTNIIDKKNNYEEYSWLLSQLGIEKVHAFFHKTQQCRVEQHIDYSFKDSSNLIHVTENEPAGYHVVLKGEVDSLEIYDGDTWVTPILPYTPCAYLLNMTECVHRLKDDPDRTTLYLNGRIDSTKHTELIERSLLKFGNLAVYRKDII